MFHVYFDCFSDDGNSANSSFPYLFVSGVLAHLLSWTLVFDYCGEFLLESVVLMCVCVCVCL